ncbi:MAG TPA: acyl-CoA dehydratase activase [Polyangia bacterium]|nr:acyl-CoA dehydratase activase [Polyangia bacterium]
MEQPGRIGVDIGAVSLKAVRIDGAGTVVQSFYARHKGEPAPVLERALRELDLKPGDSIGFCGTNATRFCEAFETRRLDIAACQIRVVHAQFPEVRNIIDIGGGSVTLVQLDAQGHFQNYATNSMCAAGTGSFLDEQAARLGLDCSDPALAGSVAEPPSIATRCSVFAKSDLIHRQQEGYSKAAMWSGLCRGMTRTLIGTLLRARPLDAPTAIIGGVALNREVLRWLDAAFPNLLRTPSSPHLVAALGAAALGAVPRRLPSRESLHRIATSSDVEYHPWPLTLEKSKYPDFHLAECYTDPEGNEVRVVSWPAGQPLRVYLGIDIGSTSTKLALVNDKDELLVDVYRKTGGDPVGATQKLCRALRELEAKKGARIEVLGAGTTGSGRKIVGEVVGADAIINEISAHVAGATFTDPSVDTIFEIGGQDAKYMHIVDGHIRDANMNYVCAAGTGSFIEEQANKLGYKVADVGQAVLGVKPPRATDRCTVFMEQDVVRFIEAGASRPEALAAVMVAVAKNYLNKVVGNRHRSRKRIMFQGATARNKALVAAFERLLDVEVVVSPYCHVMGAFGVARLVRQTMAEQRLTQSRFRGLDLDKRKITMRKETCDLCQNDCTITFADIEGVAGSPSWGYMCGRDPGEQKVRKSPFDRALRLRQRLWREGGAGVKVPDNAPVIGLPQALLTYTYYPMWQRFFNTLGFRVQLSGQTTDEIRELGPRMAGADFCFPAKLALGHVAKLAVTDGVDFVFVPHLKNTQANEETTGTAVCPYVQGTAACSRTALAMNHMDASRILSPLVDMRMRERDIIKTLTDELARPLARSSREIRRAWHAGLEAQANFEQRCYEEGAKILAEATAKNEKMILLVGRPYNNYDGGANLGLPQKIADMGRTVLPMDLLKPDLSRLGVRYRNSFWSYGQKILAALEQAAEAELLDVVYLTNFSCGPDSFLLSFAEEIMGRRPLLMLELDEHGADAGYMTRLEAFFDVLRRPRPERGPRAREHIEPSDLRGRTIWVPPMHQFGTRLFAAAFRQHGYDARTLPDEDKESFDLGRSLTRGSECLPCALTIGTLLKTLRQQPPGGKHAFFMPSSKGPCRFGQYTVLHRQILDREGFEDVAILAPASNNAYQGLDSQMRRSLFKALACADIILKAQCKVRPYEVNVGETDRVVADVTDAVAQALEKDADLPVVIRQGIGKIAAIPMAGARKPLVGIVGEIYVRNNVYANEDVIGAIEMFGGEAWMIPITDWILYTSSIENYMEEFPSTIMSWDKADTFVTYHWMKHWEQKLMRAASPFLDDRHEPPFQECMKLATPYMAFYCGGEGKLSIGRAIKFAQQGASMVVNCAPFGCMPETVATAVFGRVSADVDVPIVSLFYDGSGGQNRRLEVFLNNAVSGKRASGRMSSGGAGYGDAGAYPAREKLVPVQNLTARMRTGGNAGEPA